MGTGPIPASRKALERAGWSADDLDLIEANEAFAAQACAVNKDLGWDTDKVNVNGGAIALGHPIGASGARVFVTLLHEMIKRDAKKGLATLVHRRRHGHRHVRRPRLSDTGLAARPPAVDRCAVRRARRGNPCGPSSSILRHGYARSFGAALVE